MQELYDSHYKVYTNPGSSYWDAFKYGNKLWQTIFKYKLEPFEEEFRLQEIENNEDSIKWLLSNDKNHEKAWYGNYFEIAWVTIVLTLKPLHSVNILTVN